jgi:hypothetical protein
MAEQQHPCQDMFLHNNRYLRSSRHPLHKNKDSCNYPNAPLHVNFRLRLNNSQPVLAAIHSPNNRLQTNNANPLQADRIVTLKLPRPLLSNPHNPSTIW